MRPGHVYSKFRAPGGKSLVLRALSKGDLDAVVKFANLLVEERGRNRDLGIISLDRKVTRAAERKYLAGMTTGIARREVASVAAFDGALMVGNCDIKRRTSYDVMHTGVLGIVIMEGYRGFGLGEALIRTALGRALDMGVWLVELQVFSNNLRAIHLYEKLGFKRIGTVPDKILRRGRHIDEVLMYADLRGTDKSTRHPRR